MGNKVIIENFYSSFAKGDAEGMSRCYHESITFHDPAFGDLHGTAVMNMWRMLIERSQGELKIRYSGIIADAKTGEAKWEADYSFKQTGRKVNNKISAHFEFQDGKIVTHTDRFNLWRWSRQALGLKGFLLGWTPFFRNKMQEQTAGLLNAYRNKTNASLKEKL